MLNQVVQGAQIHQFNNISTNPIPRSTFDRSFPILTTHGTDYLIPLINDEILPGDHIRMKLKTFTRLNPTVRPIMDNLHRDTHCWFVPIRLIWENWEKFQGSQLLPGQPYEIPYYDPTKAPLNTTGFAVGSLQDYMEIPPNVVFAADTRCSSLFERAYNLICNEWYFDENLDIPLVVPTGDGPDDPATFNLQKRRKRKDYRTSALPWPQKGPEVTINFGGTAPVTMNPSGAYVNTVTNNQLITFNTNGSGTNLTNASLVAENPTGAGLFSQVPNVSKNVTFGNQTGSRVSMDSIAGIFTGTADLASASGVSVNAFRELVTLQQMLELDARVGTRYTEALYGRWGVIAQDARLQRPELVGETTSRIGVYAVPQTAPTSENAPQAQLAAYGSGLQDGYFEYTAQEHGILLVITNVRADLRYSQYLPRKRTRSTRTDFYEPIFANIGEQPVRNDEVKFQGAASDKAPFGYQEAWSNYRFKDASITGLMRPYVPNNLAVWNLSQNLGGTPLLNAAFINEQVPMDRVLAVTDEPAFLVEGHCEYIHTRAMPIRSNPGLTRI